MPVPRAGSTSLFFVTHQTQWPGAASFQHGPAYQRVLPAIGDPEFVGVHLPDGIGQLVPIGMVGNDQG